LNEKKRKRELRPFLVMCRYAVHEKEERDAEKYFLKYRDRQKERGKVTVTVMESMCREKWMG